MIGCHDRPPFLCLDIKKYPDLVKSRDKFCSSGQVGSKCQLVKKLFKEQFRLSNKSIINSARAGKPNGETRNAKNNITKLLNKPLPEIRSTAPIMPSIVEANIKSQLESEKRNVINATKTLKVIMNGSAIIFNNSFMVVSPFLLSSNYIIPCVGYANNVVKSYPISSTAWVKCVNYGFMEKPNYLKNCNALTMEKGIENIIDNRLPTRLQHLLPQSQHNTF